MEHLIAIEQLKEIDEKNRNELSRYTDYCSISGNIVYLDQMILYALMCKANVCTSLKLNDIGKETVRKLDYSHITTSIDEKPKE